MHDVATTKKIQRLVDGKAPPSRRDGIVTMKALTGDVHHAISHFAQKNVFPFGTDGRPMQDTAKKRCRFGSEWSMCKLKIWAFLLCILWSFANFLLHLLLLPYFSCCLCNIYKPKCAHVGPVASMQIRQWHWHLKLLSRWSNFPHDEPVGSLINACQQQFAQQCVFGTPGINRAHVFVHTNAKRMQWQHVVNSLWIGSCALQLYASLCDILAKSLY